MPAYVVILAVPWLLFVGYRLGKIAAYTEVSAMMVEKLVAERDVKP